MSLAVIQRLRDSDPFLGAGDGPLPNPAVNPMTAFVLPAVAGLIISRWIPFKSCVLLVIMSCTSLLFSMWLTIVLLPINGVVAYWLSGEVLAGNTIKYR